MVLIEKGGLGRRIASKGTAFQSRIFERGSLIIEALVGGVILGLVAVSLYGGFSFGFKSIRVSQEEIRADQILVDKLETLQVYSWPKLTSGTFFPTNFTSYFTPGSGANATGSGTVYAGTIAITSPPLTESYSDTLRQITVTVAWTSSGVARSRSMTTFVSQDGIQAYKN